MNGDDGDNELRWNGCDATLRGGLGDDHLGWQFDYVFETYKFTCTGEVSMNAGDGRDTLRGSQMDDLLIGGRDRHDTIEGRGGDDRDPRQPRQRQGRRRRRPRQGERRRGQRRDQGPCGR